MLKFVYGCLAFTAVALVGFIIAASEQQHFRGFNDPMAFALMEGADVLVADRSGAVTQTGDGKVFGFNAGGEKQWNTSFDRFAGQGAAPRTIDVPDASAKCSIACPSSLVTLPDEIVGEGSADPGGALTRALAGRPARILAALEPNEALAAVDEPSTLSFLKRSTEKPLGIADPGYVGLDAKQQRAVVGAVSGTSGRIYSLERDGSGWNVVGEPGRQQQLRNACISRDGSWIGSAGGTFEVRRFGAADSFTVGPQVATGTCTIDPGRITIVYSPADAPTTVVAARYDFDGRRLWVRKLGANTLLSSADAATIVVRGGPSGTTVGIDARSGREIYRHDLKSKPFVATDGSIVTADRHGTPTWQVVGGG